MKPSQHQAGQHSGWACWPASPLLLVGLTGLAPASRAGAAPSPRPKATSDHRRQPDPGLPGRRTRSRRRLLRRHLLRLHHRHPAREPPPGARRHHRRSRLRVAFVHRPPLRVDGAARHPVVGDAQHPDVARCLLLRRPLDHVLRRLGQSLPRRQRAQLPVGGHRLLAEPGLAGVHRLLHRSPLLCPGRGARPEPVRRPGHRRRLPGVEVERRQFGGAVPDLVGAARRRRDELLRDTDRPPHRGPGRAALGDHLRRSPARVQRAEPTTSSSRRGTSSPPATPRP